MASGMLGCVRSYLSLMWSHFRQHQVVVLMDGGSLLFSSWKRRFFNGSESFPLLEVLNHHAVLSVRLRRRMEYLSEGFRLRYPLSGFADGCVRNRGTYSSPAGTYST